MPDIPANHKSNKTLIQGETEEGQTFRPSDWAERMSGNLLTFSRQRRRMEYSVLLQPKMVNGQKCLLLDNTLKESNPALYEAIIAFAKSNKLKMRNED